MQKMVWGTLIAVLTIGTVVSESVSVAKAMAITGAIPFAVIVMLQIVGFLRRSGRSRRRSGRSRPAAKRLATRRTEEETPCYAS